MRLDDDPYLDTPPSHSLAIGEIKLFILRTTIPEKKIRQNTYDYLVPPQKVHERSKKAIAHQVMYVVRVGLTLYNA